MKLVSEKESEIANKLNEKRVNAYIDIYKETEFSGLGILIDENLDVYKYLWNIGFNKETHNFSNNNYLYQSKHKIKYEEIENYLINELNIMEKKYEDDSNDFEKYSQIIKLKTYIGELANKDIYDKIKEKISKMIKEDL